MSSNVIIGDLRDYWKWVAMNHGPGPTYLGLVKMGTLEYSTAEQALPYRPWRNDESFSIINNDAGTSTNVSFDGESGAKDIDITTDLFDVTLVKVGDTVTVAGSASNDGDKTVAAVTSTKITIDEAVTTESAGSTITISALGNIVDRQGGTNLDSYTFDDTSATAANILQWHKFLDIINGSPAEILIADRGLVSNVSWDHINGSNYVSGTTATIDGISYTCRLLTGGAVNRLGGSTAVYDGGALPNEWDRYVMNGVDQSSGPFFTGAPEPESADYQSDSQYLDNAARRRKHNQAWHWNASYTWCQETVIDNAASRARRGYRSARYWFQSAATGTGVTLVWRPTLVRNL